MVLRGICRKSFVGYSSKFETYSSLEREPVKFLEERLRIHMQGYHAELDSLQCRRLKADFTFCYKLLHNPFDVDSKKRVSLFLRICTFAW